MNKAKIICINGVSRSGKDSFVGFVRKKVPVIYEHSTISKVRNTLESSLMIDPSKKGKRERRFLNVVKKAWIEYNNGPFNEVVELVEKIESMYKFMNNINRVLFFVHVRESEEIIKLRTRFKNNFVSVLVYNDRVEQQPGDEEVFEVNYDFKVYNHKDLTDLNKQADEFIKYLNERFN